MPAHFPAFPRIFNRAKGELMWDEDGNQYLDFLAGAGTLNYGHNNPAFKDVLLDYIQNDGITHGLDMYTKAKKEFLQTFNEKILKPRNMEYMVQFTGPASTNAAESERSDEFTIIAGDSVSLTGKPLTLVELKR